MVGALGLVQSGGEGIPSWLASEVVGLVGKGGRDGVGVSPSRGFGESAAVLAHSVHGDGGGGAIGGAQVLDSQLGGRCLLGVTAGGMPARGGNGHQDHRGQEHRRGATVLAFAEGVAGDG